MRALKDRAGKAERLALVLCGALAMAFLMGFHVVAQTDPPIQHHSPLAHTAGGACGPYRDFWDIAGTHNPASPGGPTEKMAGDLGQYFVSTPDL